MIRMEEGRQERIGGETASKEQKRKTVTKVKQLGRINSKRKRKKLEHSQRDRDKRQL